MTTRWHRQAWRIEFKPIAGLSGSQAWHVAGTHAWVRLDGPEHLKEHCDLAKLDSKSIYQFDGIPVDQNYGTITFYLLSLPEQVAAEAPEQVDQSDAAKPAGALTAQDALCLAEACRIIALINDDKWDEVEKALGTKEGMVAILKHESTLKDWQGIGAYRGVQLNPALPGTLTFRFGFAPKSSPHEVRISFTNGNPSKPYLMVLGR